MSRKIALFLLALSLGGLTLLAWSIPGGRLFNSLQAPRSEAHHDKTPTVFEDSVLVQRYQKEITPTDLAAHVYLLASDLFEGREAATRGQKLAAYYLASQFRTMGLLPKGTEETDDSYDLRAYFQPFHLYKERAETIRFDILADGNTLTTSTFSADVYDDLAYPRSTDIVEASGPIIFAGYGIADDGLGYNDYTALAEQRLEVQGTWLMVLRDEPLADASTSLLPTSDGKPSVWTTRRQLSNKRRAAMEQGNAHGLLIVNDLGPGAQRSFAEEVAAQARSYAQRSGPMGLEPKLPPSTLPRYIMISSTFANQILATSGHTVEGLREKINKDLKPAVFEVEDVSMTVHAERAYTPFLTENVLAFIEGSDSALKDEVVIITSHYDHIGLNPSLDGDQIFNGAADDASGTAASLELAEAFMQAQADGFGPRRSLLFLHTSAEEKGLLGSAYYTDVEPVFPLEQTVANINMDGIGGFDAAHANSNKNYIYILDSGLFSQELRQINERVKDVMGIDLKLDYSQSSFRSDQQSFERHLIPFLYYSTGFVEHYHQPSDEPNTLDYAHMARVAQLAFSTVWQLANQDTRPAGLDQARLPKIGYVCPPCIEPHDDTIHDHSGFCPTCGMRLVPVEKDE